MLMLFLGKPLTTSVPSFAIRFHANAEQLEPLYASDEEHGDHHNEPTTSTGMYDKIHTIHPVKEARGLIACCCPN